MPLLEDILDKAADAYADGENSRALRYYSKAAKLDKNCVEALEWLGELYVQGDQLKRAVRYYERARRLNPKFSEYANLGYCYYELGKSEEAVEALSKAIADDAKDVVSHSNYGKALYDYFVHVDKAEARRLAEAWRRDFPNSTDAQFMGAAISGQSSPDEIVGHDFVREVFDDFADEFDKKLAELDYAAPKLLAELVVEFGDESMGRILDLGCGTGLLGISLRSLYPRAKIWGIDLSSKMLKEARGRKLYDHLKCAEIISWMSEQDSGSFDIIAAADVFCYFGDLLPAVRGAGGLLVSGGILLFSVELGGEDELGDGLSYGLHVSGRYRHSVDYAEELSGEVGLELLACRRVVLRTEYGAPVFGNVVAMRKK